MTQIRPHNLLSTSKSAGHINQLMCTLTYSRALLKSYVKDSINAYLTPYVIQVKSASISYIHSMAPLLSCQDLKISKTPYFQHGDYISLQFSLVFQIRGVSFSGELTTIHYNLTTTYSVRQAHDLLTPS